jgi:hypothetical protein
MKLDWAGLSSILGKPVAPNEAVDLPHVAALEAPT